MVAVFLSPIYVFWNAVQLVWILRWMGACHGIFRTSWMRTAVVLVYSFFALSMVVAFFLPPSPLQRALKVISNCWLGVLLHMTLTIGLALLLRLVLLHVPFGPKEYLFSRKGFVITGAICAIAAIALCVWGSVNARNLRVTRYAVEVKKPCAVQNLRVALVADLHVGYQVGNDAVAEMVDRINREKVDLVVMAGDIFDNSYEAIEDPTGLAAILSGIESKYGTYACYGNHDIEEPILAGFTFHSEKKESDPRMDRLLADAGIRLLRDEAVLVDEAFYVYGRPDARRPGRGIDVRKTPQELTQGLDMGKPILVIDHQPRELQALADAGVDLDLCGHTHDGQIFPSNLLVRLTWENPCGYLQKGKMHNIVTSGVGVFGPYMRVGTKSEVCVIDVGFSG